jgi:hypothetical protein
LIEIFSCECALAKCESGLAVSVTTPPLPIE